MGRIWPYGNTPGTFYYPMTTPSDQRWPLSTVLLFDAAHREENRW